MTSWKSQKNSFNISGRELWNSTLCSLMYMSIHYTVMQVWTVWRNPPQRPSFLETWPIGGLLRGCLPRAPNTPGLLLIYWFFWLMVLYCIAPYEVQRTTKLFALQFFTHTHAHSGTRPYAPVHTQIDCGELLASSHSRQGGWSVLWSASHCTFASLKSAVCDTAAVHFCKSLQ